MAILLRKQKSTKRSPGGRKRGGASKRSSGGGRGKLKNMPITMKRQNVKIQTKKIKELAVKLLGKIGIKKYEKMTIREKADLWAKIAGTAATAFTLCGKSPAHGPGSETHFENYLNRYYHWVNWEHGGGSEVF